MKDAKRQAEVYALLATHTTKGLTVREVEEWLGVAHGPANFALTMLHRSGHVARLRERRKGQHVHVLKGYVEGREEFAYRPRLARPRPKDLTKDQVLAVMMDAGVDEYLYPEVRKILERLP
jgi:hypothetical protein